MIQVKNLSKTYGEKTALDTVSFEIKTGEIVGLLGLNGAGKSTTMNILTGYLSPNSGSVHVNGFDMGKEPGKAKRHIGYLPEQPAFYGGMRVNEYLNFICDLKKILPDKKARQEHLDALFSQVGLSAVKRRLIRNLSKGYRQRVSFAQALVGNPKVLILDEPTVGLDPSQVMEIRQLIRERGKTATVLISSHILSEIRELCQRILVLKDGKLIADDSPENLAKLTRRPHQVKIRVKGSAQQVREALKDTAGLVSLQFLGENEEGTVDAAIETEEGTDARENVFHALAQNSLPLLYTYGSEASLEDIFLQLVRKQDDSHL
ncbi:MAG: ABC transporter ATP-binding protein [Bacillota bacterium]|nr:ABC transporter ATP-binding protein [Bacillota bacterium]